MVRFVHHVRGFMVNCFAEIRSRKAYNMTGTDHLLYKTSGASSHTPSHWARNHHYSVLQNILQSRVSKKISKSTVSQALVWISTDMWQSSHQNVSPLNVQRFSLSTTPLSQLSLTCPSILWVYNIFYSSWQYWQLGHSLSQIYEIGLDGVTRSQCFSLCTLSLSKLAANIRLCHMPHLLMVCALFVQAFRPISEGCKRYVCQSYSYHLTSSCSPHVCLNQFIHFSVRNAR